MSDERGLHEKFIVRRTDGSDSAGGRHDGCEYFVLDLTHDKHAIAALIAYKIECEKERPVLAKDLTAKVSELAKLHKHGVSVMVGSPEAAEYWADKPEEGKQ